MRNASCSNYVTPERMLSGVPRASISERSCLINPLGAGRKETPWEPAQGHSVVDGGGSLSSLRALAPPITCPESEMESLLLPSPAQLCGHWLWISTWNQEASF